MPRYQNEIKNEKANLTGTLICFVACLIFFRPWLFFVKSQSRRMVLTAKYVLFYGDHCMVFDDADDVFIVAFIMA